MPIFGVFLLCLTPVPPPPPTYPILCSRLYILLNLCGYRRIERSGLAYPLSHDVLCFSRLIVVLIGNVEEILEKKGILADVRRVI